MGAKTLVRLASWRIPGGPLERIWLDPYRKTKRGCTLDRVETSMRSAEELGRLFELSLDAFCIAGFDGYLKLANPSFARMLGYTQEELLARPFIDNVHPDDVESVRARLVELEAGLDVTRFECRQITADGSVRWLEWNTRPSPERGVLYGVGRDVTERHAADAELAALRRVATLVAAGAEPEQVFAFVAEEVARVIDVPMANIVRYEADGSAIQCASFARRGPTFPVGKRWSLEGTSVMQLVRARGKPVRLDDWSGLDGEIAEVARRAGTRSMVGVPIVVGGHLWGALMAGATDMPLPADTGERLVGFTELVVSAIANAEARDAITRLADEQAALRRVATLVGDQAAPDVIFATVAEEVARILEADRCAVGRYEPDDAMTVVAYWSDEEPKLPVGTRIDVRGDDVTAAVRGSGRLLRIDDHEAFSGPLIEYARTLGSLPSSTVAAPVFVEGRVWGAIFSSTMTPVRFPEDIEARVMDFADLVATAIANAESSEARARLGDEQAALRHVATLVARGVPPADVFAAVSHEVERVFALDEALDLATVVRFDPGPEFVLVGAAKSFEGLAIGSRWKPKDLYVSTKVFRTGRSARVQESDLTSAGGPDAETLRRQGLISQVGSPIIVEGRLWGAITMNARETLPPDTEDRLEKFTELVGTAIANAENKSALAASRRRIVAASDDARRRIERDLHDGIQQRLVSLGLAVRAAEANVPSDWGDLREELSRVASGLSDTVEGVQELSRGIHPAILSRGGLAPALRMLARRSAIPVELNLTTSDRFREPVEVAAYFVASEALTNAAKYSQASEIHISLAAREKTLELSIRDSGVGGADPARGSGLVGLADRVEALGGSIRVRSHAGEGTHITAELPLELDPVEHYEPSALPLAAIANVADALYVVDAQGRIRFLNPAALRILGYDHEKQLLGRSSHETIHYMHPDGTAFPAAECPLLLPRETGEAVHVDEDWFVRQDRTFVRVAYSSAAIPLPGGRGAVVSFRDLPPKAE
jgi:PAS domain S-box-containing protein